MHLPVFELLFLARRQPPAMHPHRQPALLKPRIQNRHVREYQSNLKCNPEKALDFRANFMAVIPAFHMNKKHWNTVQFNEDVSDILILEMVNDSYNLVIAKLPQKLKLELDLL